MGYSVRIIKALYTTQLTEWGDFILRQIAIFFILVIMSIPRLILIHMDNSAYDKANNFISDEPILHPMEALDIVKEAYATNFTKICLQENAKNYFYKLNDKDYYLVYEDTDENSGYYLFHFYEFVLDDIEAGVGHTVTYSWYWVDPYTGDMWEYP